MVLRARSGSPQLIDSVAVGIIVVDQKLKVTLWNRWMEEHSGLSSKAVISKSLTEIFPTADLAVLVRRVRQTLTLGNLGFVDARLHGHVFPFVNEQQVGRRFQYMQQTCVLAPLTNEDEERTHVCITLLDETNTVTMELTLKESHDNALELSRYDFLTQLLNRRYLYERLEQELQRLQRRNTPLAVVLIDLDRFKAINDTYGHIAGDHVLRAVSATLKESLRTADVAGRYGGEEFVLILTDTDVKGAMILAERVRETVSELIVPLANEEIHLTASFGVAQGQDGDSPDSLLQRADKALSEAKGKGRNRVVKAQ